MHSLREQQYPATRTDCVHRRPDEAVACYRENRRVSASAFSLLPHRSDCLGARSINVFPQAECFRYCKPLRIQIGSRSEEHTSELQSRFDLVCRLLLEKKKLTRYIM